MIAVVALISSVLYPGAVAIATTAVVFFATVLLWVVLRRRADDLQDGRG